jgi:hypothetical protein
VDADDETGWLEATAAQLTAGQTAGLDLPRLAEFLTDMAKRERRELTSRLLVLLAHLLKWQYQPDRRTNSWLNTIEEQQIQVRMMVSDGTLRRQALAEWGKAYATARRRALRETGLDPAAVPADPPFDLAAALAFDPDAG